MKQKAGRASYSTFQSRKDSISGPRDRSEQAQIGNRGRRILISGIFTLDHLDNSHMGDGPISLFQAVNRETRLYPFHLARAFCEKGGQQYYSCDTEEAFGRNLAVRES